MERSIPFISNTVRCQVGSVIQINLGIDPICWMGDDSINTHDLVTELHHKNLFVLKDIQIDSGLNYWAYSLELGLTGRFVEE